MRFYLIAGMSLTAVACAPPSPQPQPNEMEQVVDATRTDSAAPPGALGNESVNYGEGNITPAERNSPGEAANQSPAQVIASYANLLVQRRFDEAYAMWDPDAAGFTQAELERKFDRFETIQAALGDLAAPQGGSTYEAQLTLTGQTEDGENYSLTGPVIAARTGGEQGGWQIVKMVLTSDPQAADALVDQ